MTATVTELHPDLADDGSDRRTESWLDSLHVYWELHDVELTEIDQQASLANQARLHALDDDVVERYTADMVRGDTFPPLLALKRPRRKPMLLGGNHRMTAAIKAKRKTIAVYLVEATPEMAVRLMYEDNRRHGLPPSDEERIAQAIHLIDTGDWTETAAAACVGVSKGKINRARAVVVADRRARTLKIDGWAQLPSSSRWRLGSIRSDPVFAEAAKLALAAGLDSPKIYELATRLNECRSEAAAHKIIAAELEAVRTEIQSKGGGDTSRTKTSPRVRMMNVIAGLGACDPADVAAACANKDQAASLGRMILDTRKRLDATLAELQKRWR